MPQECPDRPQLLVLLKSSSAGKRKKKPAAPREPDTPVAASEGFGPPLVQAFTVSGLPVFVITFSPSPCQCFTWVKCPAVCAGPVSLESCLGFCFVMLLQRELYVRTARDVCLNCVCMVCFKWWNDTCNLSIVSLLHPLCCHAAPSFPRLRRCVAFYTTGHNIFNQATWQITLHSHVMNSE